MLNTVKLPEDLQEDLEATARREGVTKSVIIRRALVAEIVRLKAAATPTPYELGKDLFGKACSGRQNLSSMRARDAITKAKRASGPHR